MRITKMVNWIYETSEAVIKINKISDINLIKNTQVGETPAIIKYNLPAISAETAEILARNWALGTKVFYLDKEIKNISYRVAYKNFNVTHWSQVPKGHLKYARGLIAKGIDKKTACIQSVYRVNKETTEAVKLINKNSFSKAIKRFYKELMHTAIKKWGTALKEYGTAIAVDYSYPVQIPYKQIMLNEMNAFNMMQTKKLISAERREILKAEMPKYGWNEFHRYTVTRIKKILNNDYNNQNYNLYTDYNFDVETWLDAPRTFDIKTGKWNTSEQVYNTDINIFESSKKFEEADEAEAWLKAHDFINTLEYIHCPKCGQIMNIKEGCPKCALNFNMETQSHLLNGRMTEDDILNIYNADNSAIELFAENDSSRWDCNDRSFSDYMYENYEEEQDF